MKNLLLVLLTIASVSSFACDIDGVTGIVAENNLYIGVEDQFVGGITEADFNDAIDRAVEIYAPIFKARGKKLVVNRKWTDGTVNAYAQQRGKNWIISMFGGLARHETITKDAFATVICHELGHHIGGAPKKYGNSWASNEGQADYWGSSKCLKKYMEKDDNISIVKDMEIDPHAKEKCEANFADAEEAASCMRGAMAGLSLGNLFKVLRRQTTPIHFTTPDSKVVTRTNHSHPDSQCRLDTYFQGSLCEVDPYTDVSRTDANVGTCNRSAGHELGVRPLCWYAVAN
jgi:hypothetical protein